MDNIKSGKEIMDDFFNSIKISESINKEIAELFEKLHRQNKFTDVNLINELRKLREQDETN